VAGQVLNLQEGTTLFEPIERPITCVSALYDASEIGCVTTMKIRLRALLRKQAAQADVVASYANSMKGVTCDTSAS
jgi:hypothetical protein